MGKVLVTGCGGYIGIPLCKELLRRGHDVIGLDRFYFGKPMTVGVDSIRRDIRDINDLELGNFSIIDLAGLSNDATSEINTSLTYDINEVAAKNLAHRAARAGCQRYIYSSSASVYGHGYKQYLREDDELNPLTAYARSKVAVESMLNKLNQDYSAFEPVILRNATVFGVAPRMRFDLAVNVMTMRAWKDKRVLIMGGGMQMRPFVHVSDVVNVFCEMLERPAEQVAGKTFNVGSDAMNFTISQIASIVRQNFRDAELIMVPDDTDRRSYHVSFKKLRDLGIEPHFSIEYGVKEVRAALDAGTISVDDPTTNTLSWYKEILSWETILNLIRLDGRIL